MNRRTFIGSLCAVLVTPLWGKKAAEPVENADWYFCEFDLRTGRRYVMDYYPVTHTAKRRYLDLDADSKRATYGNLWDLYE